MLGMRNCYKFVNCKVNFQFNKEDEQSGNKSCR